MTEIEKLPASAAVDVGLMSEIADLVNRVYKVAEDGLWRDGATRTDAGEVTELTRSGEIVTARRIGQLVGCVRVQHLDAATGEFGMLAVGTWPHSSPPPAIFMIFHKPLSDHAGSSS